MNELLQGKERECNETISILKKKTDQWAQIKSQLSKYKSLRTLFPPDTSFNETESVTESFEQQTQLIPIASCNPSENYSESCEAFESEKATDWSNTENTQNHHTQLNILADLVEENQIEPEPEPETEIEAESERENVQDSFNFRPLMGITKRKGHKRGCSCCEKVGESD
jgi:hypothetical protein